MPTVSCVASLAAAWLLAECRGVYFTEKAYPEVGGFVGHEVFQVLRQARVLVDVADLDERRVRTRHLACMRRKRVFHLNVNV